MDEKHNFWKSMLLTYLLTKLKDPWNSLVRAIYCKWLGITITHNWFILIEGGSGDYPENGSGDDYPEAGGFPKKFDQCYNSYGTQKTIRYSKVFFLDFLHGMNWIVKIFPYFFRREQ